MKHAIIDATTNAPIETQEIENTPAKGDRVTLSDGRVGIVKRTGVVKENLMQKAANLGVYVQVPQQ